MADIGRSLALDHIVRDVRHGARALRSDRVFALTSLATLGLGCATMIAAFSIANAELWQPLPFPQPRQLADVEIDHGGTHDGVSLGDLHTWNAQSRLAKYAGWDSQRRTLHEDTAESVTSWEVSADFFLRLEVTPSIGRGFEDADEHGAPVAVLSDAAWRRLFNGDRSILGRAVRLDEKAYTVVGILAGTRFEFVDDPDFVLSAGSRSSGSGRMSVIARVEPGVTLPQAEGELQAIVGREQGTASPSARATVRLHDLQAYWTGYQWRQLYLFLGAAFLVLTLSCLNVSNLLVARALKRQREFAIRGALGGGTAVLVRQLFVEGALLAVPGVVAGVGGALVLLRAFTSAVPAGVLERGGNVRMDASAAVFAAAVSVTVTLLLAAAPLLSARRPTLSSLLGQRGTGGMPRQRRSRRVLLIAQTTVTMVLTAAAGVLALSFLRLTQTPLGFSPEGRVALRMPAPSASRDDAQAIRRFAGRILEEAMATPGVAEAAIGSAAPLDARGGPGIKVLLPGETPSSGGGTTSLIFGADPSYFRVLNISLLYGRGFSALDAPGAPRVCIINTRLAQRLSTGANAVGAIVNVVPRARSGWTNYAGPLTVVGVAADVKNFAIDETDYDNVYVPFAQAPSPTPELIVRASVPPAAVLGPLKAAMHLSTVRNQYLPWLL